MFGTRYASFKAHYPRVYFSCDFKLYSIVQPIEIPISFFLLSHIFFQTSQQ